jgi:nucleotide-binding universal stress UspA family protein
MNPWLILSALVTLAFVFVATPVAAAAVREWRRPWRLVCPRAGMVAQIRVEPGLAALAEVFGRRPTVARCSLWPPLAECREECLALPRDARRPMRRGEAPPRGRADAAIRLIVVPLAKAAASERALPAIAELARGCGATLRLLRVVPPVKEVRDEDDRVVVYVDQESERVEREAREELGHVAAGLEGLTVEHAVRFGEAASSIVEDSEEAGADLIALPVSRHGRLGRWLDSRVVRQLRRGTTIPLLVVPCGEAAA